MSYRIVITSFAAVAIGMSCLATDASAGGGGGGGGGHGGGGGGGTPGFRSSITGPGSGGAYFAASGVRPTPQFTVRGPAASAGKYAGAVRPRLGRGKKPFRIIGVGPQSGAADAAGGGVAAGALYYAPAAYDRNAACGRYPYPPCNRIPYR